MSPRVLVACHGREIDASLTRALSDPTRTLEVERVENSQDAVLKARSGDYDALVSCAESQADLEEVAEVRKVRSDLPILVVSSANEPGFRSQALLAGATAVIPSARDVSAVAEYLAHRLKMSHAAQMAEKHRVRAKELTQDIEGLIAEYRSLVGKSTQASGRSWKSRLLPLLVGDDPEDAFRLVRALDQAEVFAPLPLLRTSEEAVSYLSGSTPFTDRKRYPLPNIVLLSLRKEELSGIELVGWIRRQMRLNRMPVVILSDGAEPESVRQAYELHANSYLVKPGDFGDLVEMVKAIDLYWSRINFGQELL